MLISELKSGIFCIYDFIYNSKQYRLLAEVVSAHNNKATIIALSLDGKKRKTITLTRHLKRLTVDFEQKLNSLDWQAIEMHEKPALSKLELLENIDIKLKLNSVLERIENEKNAAKIAGRKPDFTVPDRYAPFEYFVPYWLKK